MKICADLPYLLDKFWKELRDEFYGSKQSDVMCGLSEQQVVGCVHRARTLHFNGDVHLHFR
ncbi:hypothetical protein PHMEG_0008387 [Phytophthora megakarya]|uniref:Uncharacterized protein n=1 Tax=Phytophthora megakarya TaxID=4795 RepID=A0A225WIX1_9STRA|nr:hypothetical protein PHMEG_0008387 [Phytophthora megakarya]